ncbi:MAG: plasmid mobilization relaxosome protein MobC [Oscillospiraceae bacterium]|nr:plasmid mobilization relaxosome protein MobC [Oscillospiraceae bacterium]
MIIQNLKRSINLGFRVTEEEKALIYRRMEEVGIRNLRAYLLKMALNGMLVTLDLKDVRECNRLLRNLTNNVNQIAKRVNGGGNVHSADLAKVQSTLSAVWNQQDKIIRSLTKVLEVA